MQAHCLSQAPLDTVPHHGFAEGFGSGESDARSDGLGLADTKSGEQGTTVT